MDFNIEKLIVDLSNLQLQPQIIREFIETIISQKVSRTSAPDYLIPDLLKILESHGIISGVSKFKYYAPADEGKGGWCNIAPVRLSQGSFIGEHLIYSGSSASRVYHAMDAEHSGDDQKFGELLGIPSCCTQHYENNINNAAKLQNDLTIFTYKNTNNQKPILSGTNYFPQYFGYGLFNYFPCSFNCIATHKRTNSIQDQLHKLSPTFSELFCIHQRRSVLYTEYDGIFSFKTEKEVNNKFKITCGNILATSSGVMSSILNNASEIAVISPSHIKIFNDQKILLDVEHEHIAFIDFN